MAVRSSQGGFVLPVVVATVLVVAVIASGALSYINHGTRVAGTYEAASACRFAAQAALETAKAQVKDAFAAYYKAYPSPWSALTWFDAYSSASIGSAGYVCQLPQNVTVGKSSVSVALTGVTKSAVSTVYQYAYVTFQATATGKSAHGIAVSKTIEETVEFALRRSTVFDHAYFVNNYGWFLGSGVTANGNIRSNGNLLLDSYSYINGDAFAAVSTELGANGYITVDGGGTTRYMDRSTYWGSAGTRARPTNPTSSDTTSTWAMGYECKSELNEYQETLVMPYLSDLSGYREVAYNTGGTIKQGGTVLVDGCFSGTGPSGISGGADVGCLVLDGTSKAIELSGVVVVDGDVVIKGTVTGQGAIYAGRNIHIVGNVTYKNAPSWSKPDSSPDKTIKSNASADMVGLVAKGNIVLGNYTDSTWLSAVKGYITPPWVSSYACDASDASIGYGTTFSGDYTAYDSGKKVTYTYNSKTKTYTASGTASRKYYESTVGDQVIKNNIASSAITQIDAVLYNNHAVMGKTGQCLFNGALVCRDEGIIYSSSVKFNWDSRLGSRSPDGVDFFVYLPMAVSNPSVVSWREVAL